MKNRVVCVLNRISAIYVEEYLVECLEVATGKVIKRERVDKGRTSVTFSQLSEATLYR